MLDIRELEMEARLNKRCRELWDHSDQWWEIDTGELSLLTIGKCLEHGYTLDSSWVSRMKELYAVYSYRVDWGRRVGDLGVIDSLVKTVDDLQIGAFTPIIFSDPEPRMVVLASRMAAYLAELVEGDPLTGAKLLMSIAPDAMNQRTRAGIYGGLLSLGDRSHLPVAAGCWRHLAPRYQHLLANICSDFPFANVVDFLLDWMEQAEDDEEYMAICIALAHIPSHEDGKPTTVCDYQWMFPETGRVGLPSQTLLGEWTFEEYGQIIKPRLLDLAELETERFVIPTVLMHWGDSSLLDEAEESGRTEGLVYFATEGGVQ